MALPRQIQAALDAADATLLEANGQPPTSDPSFPAQDEPTSPQPEPQAEPQPQAAPERPPAATDKPDIWEARYKSLQGTFNKTVPELQQQVKSLQSDLSTAVERLNRASEQKESPPEQHKATDPRDVENFGADLVDMVGRVAGAAVGQAAKTFDARVAHFEAQLNQLTQALQGTTKQVAMTAEDAFFERVTKLVPDWRDINADQGFLTWLAVPDPIYGVSRQAALEQAQSVMDADRAAAVFIAYAGPQKTAPKGPDPLDKQMSPKGAATVTPTPGDKPVFTQAQITAFYDDVRKGLYRGREQEFNRIEQLINTALSEGRVR